MHEAAPVGHRYAMLGDVPIGAEKVQCKCRSGIYLSARERSKEVRIDAVLCFGLQYLVPSGLIVNAVPARNEQQFHFVRPSVRPCLLLPLSLIHI